MNEAEAMRKQIVRWRTDPVAFVRTVFGVEPTKQQQAILMGVAAPGARISAKSGHGTGKTTVLAWIIWWHVLLFPDSKTPCTAPTKSQLKNALWAELAKWRSKADPWFRDQMEMTSEDVFLKERKTMQFAVARTASKDNPEALQGFHATNILFVIDEASGVDEGVFDVIEGALSTAGARVVMMSNPTRLTGYFHRSHNRDKHRWSRYTLSCVDSPRVSREYIEDLAATYGEDSDLYKVRVLGQFGSASDAQLIPADSVVAAMGRQVHPSDYDYAATVIGVDVATSENGDRSVIFLRQGPAAQLLFEKRGIKPPALANKVALLAKEHKADAIFVDAGAAGPGVIGILEVLGHAPIGIHFGGASSSPRYANKRAEMWCLMRDWLADGGCIPESEDLRDELVGPECSYRPKDSALLLEDKDHMKKRGLASPDLADALALTFAMPVEPRGATREAAAVIEGSFMDDYNPFE